MKQRIVMCAALALGWAGAAEVFVANGVQYVRPEEFAKENGLTYTNNLGTITIKSARTTLVMLAVSKNAEVNGKARILKGPVTNIAGYLMAPLADLQKVFGLKVTATSTTTAPSVRPSPTTQIPAQTKSTPSRNYTTAEGVRVVYENKGFRTDPLFQYSRSFPMGSIKIETPGAMIAVCKGILKAGLKAPATAKFSNEYLFAYNDQSWTLSGVVDSQNSYGALLRSNYMCNARINGSNIDVHIYFSN